MTIRRPQHRRPRPGSQLICWALAVLMVAVPGLSSAGGRGPARRAKSKARVSKLKALRAQRGKPAVSKQRARTQRRGAKLSNRLRLRSRVAKPKAPAAGKKMAAKLGKLRSLGKLRNKDKLRSKDQRARTRVDKRKQRSRARARARAKARKNKPRAGSKRRQRPRRARANMSTDGDGSLAEQTLTNTGTLGLLANGARSIHRAANLNRSLHTVLGVAAPLALAIGSTYAMTRARSFEARSEAGHGLLWAAQGGVDFAGKSFANVGIGLGLAGGSIQVGVGAYRVWTGIKSRNWPRVVTGVLDATAGSAWALTAVSFALPTTMGVFIGATAVKMIYENRKSIAKGARKIGDRLGSWGKRLRNFGLPKKSKAKARLAASL